VVLFGAALRAGAPPGPALEVVCAALPGPASDRLLPVTARLALGGDPAQVWRSLAADSELSPLGRCLARAHTTGSPVAEAVTRLGQELAAERRLQTQERARAVGVRAALPLGICLLPAFLLLGIVPVVAGLAAVLLGG
jgi:Flp pilus assembly protein TadB